MIKNVLKNKNVLFALIGVILGVLLILFGSLKGDSESETPTGESPKYSSEALESYTSSLEEKIQALIEKIGGVSDVSVLVTIDGSQEKVYATEGANKDYVIVGDKNGSGNALQIMEISATVRGIAVVCDYGNDEVLRQRIIEMLASLFNIGVNRVSVVST